MVVIKILWTEPDQITFGYQRTFRYKKCKVVPRIFRLLAELDSPGDGYCTLGLEKADDNTFTFWNASIISPNGEKIYELKIVCGEDYPEKPPKIKFVSKINMACVNQKTGWVDGSSLSIFSNWTRSSTMDDCLKALRKEMESSAFKKLQQPAEGSVFP